jgi:Na+-translocating ferredoxin:NAD+ oxidoreductase subunit B
MEQVWISVLSLGSIGLLFGIILSFLDKKLQVFEDPKVKEVNRRLPGINCGACGFAGCLAYSKAAVKENSLLGGCKPGGEEVNKSVASVLKVEDSGFQKQKVVVLCQAGQDQKKQSFIYSGPRACFLAQQSLGGIDCKYGCLGLGDCLKVCPTQALSLDKLKVTVDYDKCIGCGKCVQVCPRGILELVEAGLSQYYFVACKNPEKALDTKKVCSAGCIGCGICARLVKDSPFHLEEGLAKIEVNRLKNTDSSDLDKIKDKCPSGVIKRVEFKC